MNLLTMDLVLGFIAWAQPRGYDLARTAEGDFTNLETRNAWLGYEAAHGEEVNTTGQQLYARIRKSSQYAHQSKDLFPVRIAPAPYGDFVVHGGPGGLYGLRDVHLFVLVDDQPMRLG